MNVNTPLIYTVVKTAEVSKNSSDYFWECRIFGASSLPGRAVLFHCQLNNGAVYYRLPISAFGVGYEFGLGLLQTWDCASKDMECFTFDYLNFQSVTCLKLNKATGTYITTFDWSGYGSTAEIAHEHKCLHLIKLNNGQFALQPNNYLLWHEKSNVKIDDSHKLMTTNKPYPSVESLTLRGNENDRP